MKCPQIVKFGDLLAGSDAFVVPSFYADLSTPRVLAMRYVESQPLDALLDAPQDLRDRVATQLIDLTLQELFLFGAMQTDPNLANYRYDPNTASIVLLDFGAVQSIPSQLTDDFRRLLRCALDADQAETRAAMLQIGYFNSDTAQHHQDLIQTMFVAAMAPLRVQGVFDFGQSDLLERLRKMGMAIGQDRELSHVPPAATLFLHRKIGGMYLMATKLRARVALRKLIERYR